MKVHLEGAFDLEGVSAEKAMTLFTAEGEKLWAPGWDPVYPGHEQDVWLTGGTHWVTTASTATSATYARVTPGDSAGWVSVEVTQQGADVEVFVVYDLVALTEEGAERLVAFAEDYEQMMVTWQELTQSHC